MPNYQYHGPYTVTARLSGGPESLKKWAEQSAGSPGGPVHLCDRLGVRAALHLSPEAVDAGWSADQFQGDEGDSLLSLSAEADSPSACKAALDATLFGRFAGQPETGEAHFPVAIYGAACRTSRDGRVIAQCNPRHYYGAALEHLTLSIAPAASADPANWREAPAQKHASLREALKDATARVKSGMDEALKVATAHVKSGNWLALPEGFTVYTRRPGEASPGDGLALAEGRLLAAGIDPLTVAALIAAVVQLIASCPLQDPELALRRTPGRRALLAAGVRRQRPEVSWRDAFAAADAALDAASRATAHEARCLVEDCLR